MRLKLKNIINDVSTYCNPIVICDQKIMFVNSGHQLMVSDNGNSGLINKNEFGSLFLVGEKHILF